MNETTELAPNIEHKIATTITLEFLRHGEAVVFDINQISPERSGNDVDIERELTPTGVKQSADRGKKINAKPETSVSFGSGRKRANQSAAIALAIALGIEIDSSNSGSVDDAVNLIKEQKKLGQESLLDFSLGPETSQGLEYMSKVRESLKDNRFIDFLVFESKEESKRLGIETTTYEIAAKNAARIVRKYFCILSRFQTLTEQDRFQGIDEMTRILGTHQGLAESFILKLIEQKEGEAKTRELAEKLGNGFGEAEGITIKITENDEHKPAAHISYVGQRNDLNISISFSESDLLKILEEDESSKSD